MKHLFIIQQEKAAGVFHLFLQIASRNAAQKLHLVKIPFILFILFFYLRLRVETELIRLDLRNSFTLGREINILLKHEAGF